jgi:type II secretory pathway component GspD/PulD (secretin)
LKILSPRGTIITSQSKDQSKINIKSTGSAVEAQNIQNPSITTAIIVSDIKEYVDKVEALIAQLDRREPQVFIEARVIDVGITYDQKLGFDWGMLDKLGVSASLKDASWKFTDNRSQTMSTDNRDYQYDKRNNLDSLNRNYDVNGVEFEKVTYVDRKLADGTTISEPQVTPTRTIADTINKGRELSSDKKDNILNTFTEGKMGTMVLSATDVQLYLSALRTTGNADTLSHPVLIVGNKVEAKIHVGEQTWKISLKKDTTTIGASPVDRYSEDASPMDLGLKLWLIPEIDLPNDVVRMTIEPEMTVFVRNIVTAQGSVYPVTSTRRLSTRVTIPSTHTVVVGGLVENKKAKKEKRVPLIGDVPLLGYLFRHTEDIEERHNLLIMLTPTILDERRPLTGMEAIAQLTVNKYEQNPLAANKYVPTNQPFGQSLATNLITPSAGLMNAGQPASPALPPSVTDTSAVPPAANVQLIQQLLSNSATLNQPAPSVPPAPGN